MDFYRAVVVSARDVQVHHRYLQDPSVQIAYATLFIVPGILQGLVCLKILPRVEQAESLLSLRVEWGSAVVA